MIFNFLNHFKMNLKTDKTQRGYISWSQINTFNESPWQYYQRYWLNVKTPQTPQMKLGCAVEDALAPIMEEEGYTNNRDKTKCDFNLLGEYKITGYYDFLKKNDPNTMIELKTGKKWDQERVDNHGQLKLYALAMHNKNKKIPKIQLFYFEKTEKQSDSTYVLEYNGDTLFFEKHVFDFHVTEEKIRKWLEEFSEHCDKICRFSELQNSKDYKFLGLIEGLERRMSNLGSIDQDVKGLQSEIKKEMKEKGVDAYFGNVLRISPRRKNTYSYSQQYLDFEQEVEKMKDKLKIMKKKEEETADCVTTIGSTTFTLSKNV